MSGFITSQFSVMYLMETFTNYNPCRENMLEFHHKVDHTREQKNATHLSSSDSSPLLEVPEAETPQSSMAKSYDQSSGSQRFGLRLAPPSQQLPNSNSLFTLQNSPKSVSSASLRCVNPH